MKRTILPFAILTFILFACNNSDNNDTPPDEITQEDQDIIDATLNIDLYNLHNYANQTIPAYIGKDNTGNNPITDLGATLGAVDKVVVNAGVAHSAPINDLDLEVEGPDGLFLGNEFDVANGVSRTGGSADPLNGTIVADALGLLLVVVVSAASADDGTFAPEVLGRLTGEHRSRLALIWAQQHWRP